MLDEQALRLPRWNEHAGEWIELAGQRWLFPKPLAVLRPIVKAGRYLRSEGVACLGPDFDAIRDEVSRAADEANEDGGNILPFIEASQAVAVAMLSHFYAIPDDAYGPLLDTASAPLETLIEIARVAVGRGKKPSPAGDESQPMSPADAPT